MRIPDFYIGDTLDPIVINFYDSVGNPVVRTGTMYFTLKTSLGATETLQLTTPVAGSTVTVQVASTDAKLVPEGRYLLELRLIAADYTHVVHSQSIQVRTPLYETP